MSDNGYTGQQNPTDTTGEFNSSLAIARSVTARMSTATEVQVVSVTNSGGLSPVGFVDVQPLVNQVDGAGKSTPHGILHRLPYFRLQGGTDAVILDPKVGDIGIAVFADHDISAVNNAKAQANPGSGRRFDMADGMYIGGVLNGKPEQYIQFNTEGIHVHSPTKIKFTAPEIELIAENSIKSNAPTIQTEADTITSTATASITDNAPVATTNAPLIGLNGTIVQTAGSGVGESTMEGPLHVTQQIKSDTEVIAVTTPLHTHVHGGVVVGGANTSGPSP